MDTDTKQPLRPLAIARAAAGFTSQQALAVTAGLSMRTVQRIEAGQPPARESARAIARVLGMTSDELFDLLDPEGAVA